MYELKFNNYKLIKNRKQIVFKNIGYIMIVREQTDIYKKRFKYILYGKISRLPGNYILSPSLNYTKYSFCIIGYKILGSAPF